MLGRQNSVVRTLNRRSFFDKVGRNWDEAWKQQVTPWELGTVSKPLIEYCSKQKIGPNQRAFVPGCGSGHDCVYLSRSGYREVVGLDLSPTAIELCTELQRVTNTFNGLKFECGDLFSYNNDRFDFIYDQLVFSAIEPTQRAQWATAMARLLRPQLGRLLTLVFPLAQMTNGKKKLSPFGPPYEVTVNCYEEVLVPLGFRLLSADMVGLLKT